eukprot:8940589-Alexandrium_andersonii.AAC.1
MFAVLASAGPRGKGFADCGLSDCGLKLALRRFRTFGPPEAPLSWADSESTRTTAQNAPLSSFGGQLSARSWARAVP